MVVSENLHEGREGVNGDPRSARGYRRLPLGARLLRGRAPFRWSLGVASFHGDLGHDRNAQRSGTFWIEAAVDDDSSPARAATTLTKLPVGVLDRKGREFRAGAELNAVDMAAQIERGIGVDLMRAGCSRAHVGELASLKFAVTHTSGATIVKICWPGAT